MISKLVKGRRKYSCTSCLNVNEPHEKHTETLKADKLRENEPSDTITEQEIENLKLLLSEKETDIEKLDKSQPVNEKIIADMKHEIKNLKKEMQVQSNLIKLKKDKICEKTQTIDQNEKENINYNKGNYWKRKN